MSSRSEAERPLRLLRGLDQHHLPGPTPIARLRSPTPKDAAVLLVRKRLREGIRRAPLSVPLTAFDTAGALELDAFRGYVEDQVAARPGAIFVCCLPGEFSSLSLTEFEALVRVAADSAGGEVPVIAGIGHRAAMAIEFAHAAERAGADGGLLLMSSLMSSSPDGFVAHTRAVAARTPCR